MTSVSKWLVVTGGALILAAVLGWWYFLKPIFVRELGGVPAGTVAAFDLSGDCPDGWSKFDDANGLTLIGSSPSMLFRTTGGKAQVKLTEANVPQHQHNTYLHAAEKPFGRGPIIDNAVIGYTNAREYTSLTSPWGKADPDPVPILPPYLVLKFCKRS